MTEYRATALFNETYGSRFNQWTPDAVLVKSGLSVVVSGATAKAAAEQAYRLYNADDRPNGATERSVSVGDIIVLDDGSTSTRAMAVESFDWADVTDRIDVRYLNMAILPPDEYDTWAEQAAAARARMLARRQP